MQTKSNQFKLLFGLHRLGIYVWNPNKRLPSYEKCLGLIKLPIFKKKS